MSGWSDFVRSKREENALHLLARTGNTSALGHAVDVAMRSGEPVDLTDAKGYSPLMLACYHGNLDAAKLLLTRGADPNLQDNTGNTILMGAAFKGYLDIVRLLIDNGADRSVQNRQGLTALGFAEMSGRTEVAEYLRRMN